NAEHNLFYLNDGHGHFTQAGPELASFCDPMEVSHGLAIADVDNDGDIDMLISNTNGVARLYRNDVPRSPNAHWLMVRAVDPRLHRDALGARVTVTCGLRRFVRTIGGGGSYLSSSDFRAHFGLGAANAIDRSDVRRP